MTKHKNFNFNKLGEYRKTKRYWIGIIICAVIFALFSILMYYITFSSKPSFTIIDLKNECGNETGTYDGYKCEDGSLLLGGYEEYLEIVTENGLRCFRNNDTWKEQVCEQKEVEEIKIIKKGFEKCFEDNTFCISNEQPYEYITKSFLQKNPEWLGVNCECYTKEGKKVIWNIAENDSEYLDCGRDFDGAKEVCASRSRIDVCSKYSCVDRKFEVEVSR